MATTHKRTKETARVYLLNCITKLVKQRDQHLPDCLIYSGCEVQHWRDENPNDLQVQHFFHFYSPHSRAGSFIEQMDDSYKGWNGFLANEIWPGNLELMQKHNITPLPRRQDV